VRLRAPRLLDRTEKPSLIQSAAAFSLPVQALAFWIFQKKQAFKSKPQIAKSSDTSKPTPENMARVFRMSTSMSVVFDA
jgi:hypothetical protein